MCMILPMRPWRYWGMSILVLDTVWASDFLWIVHHIPIIASGQSTVAWRDWNSEIKGQTQKERLPVMGF